MAKSIRYIIFLVLLVTTAPLWARYGHEEKPIFRVKFSACSTVMYQGLKYFVQSGEVAEVKLSRSRLSERYEYEGTSPIIFFKEEPAPTKSNPDFMRKIPVARVAISEQTKDMLFFFFENESEEIGADELRIFPINGNLALFPKNTLKIFNATEHSIVGKMGTQEVSFKTGLSENYNIYSGGLQCLLGVENKYGIIRQAYKSNIRLKKSERAILLFLPSKLKGSIRPRARLFIDHLKVEPEKKR